MGKNPQEKTVKNPEKLEKKTDLPEFPEEKESPSEKPEDSIPGISDEDHEEYITEVCKDLICIPFEIWHVLNPKVNPLSDLEKKHISKPLAKVAMKYHVDRLMKEEIMLFTFLGFAILQRARIKKDDINDSGKKGKRKDDTSEKSDKD